MKKRLRYQKDLPRRMYTYFNSYAEGFGAPSFSKFARSIGVTLAELESFKRNDEFERSWRECSEIRKDYLIDTALTKRFDPSFVKFLLSAELGFGEDTENEEEKALKVTLEVIEDEKNGS